MLAQWILFIEWMFFDMTAEGKICLVVVFQIIVQSRCVRSVVSLVSAESLTLTNCRHLCHQILFWGKYTWNFSSLGNTSQVGPYIIRKNSLNSITIQSLVQKISLYHWVSKSSMFGLNHQSLHFFKQNIHQSLLRLKLTHCDVIFFKNFNIYIFV